MKTPFIFCTALIAIGLTLPALAQTDTNAQPAPAATQGNPLIHIGTDLYTFIKDNTNFWDQHTLMAGVSGLYSHGHSEGTTDKDHDVFGGVVDVRFPLDANGQVSVGFMAAYFNKDLYDGSISTTLGTTWNIPLINLPVFTFFEGGPTLNFSHPDKLGAQAFTGGVTKFNLTKATTTSAPWILYVNAAAGKVSDWHGGILLFGPEIGHKF